MAVVVAQMEDWLLPTPEICCSNPDMGNYLSIAIQKRQK